MNRQHLTAALLLIGTFSVFAGPVTTVPWNGHTGAVSYTYDDARASQLPNLLPQLDSLKIKATFEIPITGVGTFSANRAAWIQVSRNGHELANHTYPHTSLTDANAAGLVKEGRVGGALAGEDIAARAVGAVGDGQQLVADALEFLAEAGAFGV